MTSPFVGFENQVNMTPAVTAPAQATEVKQAAAVLPATPADSVELSSKEPKQRKGLFGSIKSGIASIKKAFASIGAYTKGIFKGIGNAAIGGSIVYTGSKIVNTANARKLAKAGGDAVGKAKNLPAAILGAGAAALAFGISLFNAHLDATEASSNIDHRWTGHAE